MSIKRIPTDADIETLAEIFRPLWREGDAIRPWLRQHHELLRSLVHGEWSWAAVGAALTKIGITYRTGRPWTNKRLRSELSRAMMPLKGYRRRKPKIEAQPTAETTMPPGAPAQTAQPPLPSYAPTVPNVPLSSTVASTPRFKPASFRVPDSVVASSDAAAPEATRDHRLTPSPIAPEEPR